MYINYLYQHMDMYLETSPTASNNQDTSSWYSHCGDNRMACREKLFYSVFLLQHSHRIRKIKMKEAFLSVVYYFSVYQMFLECPLNDEINFTDKIILDIPESVLTHGHKVGVRTILR